MERLVYLLFLGLVKILQSLPMPIVAWLGRLGGGGAYWLDARHRRVALRNLTRCFGGEKTAREIRTLARENFRRLGENYACAIKTAAMTLEEIERYCEFVGAERIQPRPDENPVRNRLVAIGHFGNFELYARFGRLIPTFQGATTYRALRQPLLNRLMQSLREHSGCLFFERRTQAAELKALMNRSRIMLGLFADQHAGHGGVRAPFLGLECSTTAAPAILALRYDCQLHTGACYRVGPGRWRIEAGEEIPIREGNRPRSIEAITRDINAAFEAIVRRDPANWFWVHNRWKTPRASLKQETSDPVPIAGAGIDSS